MLVCPGFGSSSESSYIRALVTNAQSSGYRVAVLNHLGSLFSVKLTAPRIFTYGEWRCEIVITKYKVLTAGI